MWLIFQNAFISLVSYLGTKNKEREQKAERKGKKNKDYLELIPKDLSQYQLLSELALHEAIGKICPMH
jgi:hypothetical protein